MAELLTDEDFSKHLHTKFRLSAESPLESAVELELDEVASYQRGPNEPTDMVRFSLFFEGPRQIILNQGTFSLEHEEMGALSLFIVPLGPSERGFRYESVFNYFKT